GVLYAAVRHQSESEHAKGEIGGQNAEYSQLHGWHSHMRILVLLCRIHRMCFKADDFFFQLIYELLKRLFGKFACPHVGHRLSSQFPKASFQEFKFSARVIQLTLALNAHNKTSMTPLGTESRSDP